MTAVTEFVDYYALLQVPETAEPSAITQAIRNQRRTWNKRAGQSDAAKRQQAEVRIKQLADAERVLLDPAQRRAYDQSASSARATTRRAPAPTDSSATSWIDQARDYFSAGNAASAYYAAREAIQQDGRNHQAWAIRANSSFLLGKFADAEFEFNEAIRLQPDNAEYHFDLAESRAARGEWVDALASYETALRLAPGDPVYRTAIANVYLQNRVPDRALELMEGVVREYPDTPIFQYYLALALHDENIQKWATASGVGRTIISEAQIEVTRQMSGRALSLRFDDEELRASLQDNLNRADEAAEVRFFHSSLGGWSLAAVISFALIWFYGLGVLLLPAVIYGYVYFHRMPVWKYRSNANIWQSRGI